MVDPDDRGLQPEWTETAILKLPGTWSGCNSLAALHPHTLVASQALQDLRKRRVYLGTINPDICRHDSSHPSGTGRS